MEPDRLGATLAMPDRNPDDYDASHVVGGGGPVIDGKLITGQNQRSASAFAIAFDHLIAHKSPVVGR